MANWDESKVFWAETWRSVVFAILSVAGGIYIVSAIQDRSAYKAEIKKQKLTIKAAAIDDFVAKGYAYTSSAAGACKGDSTDIIHFEGSAFDDYRIAQVKMRVYFSNIIDVKLDSVAQLSSLIKNNMKSHQTVDCENAREQLKDLNVEIALEAWLEIDRA